MIAMTTQAAMTTQPTCTAGDAKPSPTAAATMTQVPGRPTGIMARASSSTSANTKIMASWRWR